MDLLSPFPTGAPTGSQLADALVDFLEAAFHQVLCVRRVYPSATFRRVRRFGQLCWWSQSPALSAYLRDVCTSVKEALQRQLVHRLLIVLVDEQDHECERYIFEFAPLFTPAAVAASTAARGWLGRTENQPFSAAVAQQPPVGTSKSYSIRREDSSCSSTSVPTLNSGVTCSNIPMSGTSSYRSSSTPTGHGSFEGTGGGSRAWRRLTAAFQDALTKLELVGCWLDADDTDDEANEDSEDSSFVERSEDSPGTVQEIRKGMPERTVAARHPSAPLPSSASTSSCDSTSMGITVPRSPPAEATQCFRAGATHSQSMTGENAAPAADTGRHSSCAAAASRITVLRGAQRRFRSRGGRSTFHQGEGRTSCWFSARSFRVQLQQDAEVLQSLDTAAAAVPRPLSCFDEDLRVMLLLRSRWLPSATSESSWGLHNRERQQSSFRQSMAEGILCASPGGGAGQRSSSSTGRDVKGFLGRCVISSKTSNDLHGGGGIDGNGSVQGTPLFDTFVLASIPRLMIFAWEPRSRSGRAASPVLPCNQQFGRSGGALLRIIVQQSRGGLRSPEGQQQRAKRRLSSLSRYSMQSDAVSTAAAENDGTTIREAQRRKGRTASEFPSICDTQQEPTGRLLQRARYERQSGGERQLGTAELQRECPEETHQRVEHMQLEEESHSQVAQQYSSKKRETVQEAEKLKILKRCRTDLPEEDRTSILRSRTDGESAETSIKSCDDKPPGRLATPVVVAVSVSFMDSLVVSEAASAVVDAAKKSSATGAKSVAAETPELRATTSSEDMLPSECDGESGTALLFDAHVDNLF